MKKRDIPEKICAFCENGTRMVDEDTVLCSKKGPVASDFHCRRFTFDPLKEKPSPAPLKKVKMETL